MSNPWLKKNPYMSLWLSAANRAAGPVRGAVTAETKRQAALATAAAASTIFDLWLGAAAAGKQAKPRRRK